MDAAASPLTQACVLDSRLLAEFARTFEGQKYRHRDQGIGNFIASHLYEDLFSLGRSTKYTGRVSNATRVVNGPNRVVGRQGRRGDGTFGELVPGQSSLAVDGFAVRRGPIATLEIGAECKTVGKAMLKQIDRVINDLGGQARTFRRQTRDVIRVAIVGVNFSENYTSYEGNRAYPAQVSPAREAPKVIPLVEKEVRRLYDELLILRFKATNVPPYPFEWVDRNDTYSDYAAALVRLSKLYDERF